MQLSFDIGGTFTDFVAVDEATGDATFHKVLTTPREPAVGGLAGLEELLAQLECTQLATIIHATTLVTNAIIERKGSHIGLITTAGFRDTLEMRREQRYDVYDLFIRFPEPIVPRHRRIDVTERIRSTGQVITPLNEDDVADAAKYLVEEQGVEAIAIVFLHAYRNSVHEVRAREIIHALYPHIAVSMSCEVAPEIREYERTSTTVLNAYVQRVVAAYLGQLAAGFRQHEYLADFYVMLSAGGLANSRTAAQFPIRMVESGPAAGVLGAIYYAQQLGESNLLSFDLGGTTAKYAVVRDGEPALVSEFEVDRIHRFTPGSGLPVTVPVIEMIEIGAGGGSVAHLNEMGLLQVGPQSAGADPGPACYGRGGAEPTVTDADLVLGYLNPDYFLGGRMHLDVPAARGALEHNLCGALGVDAVEAAWGVFEVVNENMASAARVHMAERGCNPETFTMVAFGGAGPVHAYRVAEALYVRRIICPYGAGVASAVGLLAAPMTFDLARSYVTRLDQAQWAEIDGIYEEMELQARAILLDAGIQSDAITIERSADVRHSGQFFEFNLPLDEAWLRQREVDAFAGAFHSTYKRLYGHANVDVPIEIVNWRLRAKGPARPLRLQPPSGAKSRARRTERRVWFAETHGFVATPVYDRFALSPGEHIPGPAIIEEPESTAVVGPSWSVVMSPSFALVMTRERDGAKA